MPKSRRSILKCAAALYLSLSALSCPSAPQPHERSDQIRSACVVVLDELRPAGPVHTRHMPSRLHFVICCCSGMACNRLVFNMFFGCLEGNAHRCKLTFTDLVTFSASLSYRILQQENFCRLSEVCRRGPRYSGCT